MAEIISCVNLKGGVGKTAIAVNLAAYCGMTGKKTLLIDLDPQTNATFSCIDIDVWQEHAASNGTVANLLFSRRHSSAEDREVDVDSVIVNNVFDNVDLIPSHLDLFTIDLDLASSTARERLLKKALKDKMGDYDIIICDCPPNLTLPTQNALALSTHYVIPISPDYLSGIGVGLLITRVKQFCDDMEQQITNLGIIVTRIGRKALHREQTIAAIREQFGDLVFDSMIKERVSVSESAATKKSIFQTNDRYAINEFNNFSDELLSRIEV